MAPSIIRKMMGKDDPADNGTDTGVSRQLSTDSSASSTPRSDFAADTTDASRSTSLSSNGVDDNHDHRQGRQQMFTGPAGDFGKHTRGHGNDQTSLTGYEDPSTVKDHTHLKPVTHVNVTRKVIEEVERERDHTRHVHHVQHRVQPIADEVHTDEKHHHFSHPVTNVHETHANTEEDKTLFNQLGVHKDEHHHAGEQRQIVDAGEKVNEKIVHHVHNVMSKADFLKNGGILDSATTHSASDAVKMHVDPCERKVDGTGEKLIQELGLGKGTHFAGKGHTHTGAGAEQGGNAGTVSDGYGAGTGKGTEGAAGVSKFNTVKDNGRLPAGSGIGTDGSG